MCLGNCYYSIPKHIFIYVHYSTRKISLRFSNAIIFIIWYIIKTVFGDFLNYLNAFLNESLNISLPPISIISNND